MSSGTQKPVVRKLGARLNHLLDWALACEPYSDIWDLCCDHGRLGLHLHQSPVLRASKLHLLDCVPSVIDVLKNRYQAYIDHRLNIYCADAAALQLPSSGRHLIIIAGVGGETAAKIIAGITANLRAEQALAKDFCLEYFLSPNHNNFELRRYLRQGNFELLKEEFVSEKGWHHEHLHLRYHLQPGNYQKSSVIGESLWYPLTDAKKRYLQKYYWHYKNRVDLGGIENLEPAVAAYGALLSEA